MLSKLTSKSRISANSIRAFASSKEIHHSADARAQMLAGVVQLADAVAVTMGPKGRNVVIEQSFGGPKVTKDGVTVAKAIELPNKMENIGASLIKQVASRTNEKAGDGTTCSTVLARAIYKEGCRMVAAGMNPMDLKRGIDAAVKVVLEFLKEHAKPISTPQEIAQVAAIAANNDKVIGDLIAQAYEKVGRNGTITVAEGKTLEHELEVVEGLKFDRGYISPYFVTNPKTSKVEFENPVVLVHEKKISAISTILPVLEHALKSQRPLLIIAEDVEGEALATLILNKLRAGLKIAAVKAPGFGDHRKACMVDIATICGAQVISEETGTTLESITQPNGPGGAPADPASIAMGLENILGSAKNVALTKDDTIILDGAGEVDSINARCDIINSAIELSTSEYETDKLKERLAKLSGGVAVIKVGGASEVEVGEVKDRLDDALCATRAAVEEGIVPGGGTALIRSIGAIDERIGQLENEDQRVGVNIVRTAVMMPARTIAQNAGDEGAVVVQKVLARQDDFAYGYDAQRSEYVNLIERGIIDPTKVIRTALADAASVASLMTTTEAVICEIPEEKSAPAPAGGMGGMDGMY